MCENESLDFDMAVPTNSKSISEYYENLKDISRRDSTSSDNTVDSEESEIEDTLAKSKHNNEVFSHNSSPNEIPQLNLPDINSISVTNSSDIKIGHNINYNGPITIQRQVIVQKNRKSENNDQKGEFQIFTLKIVLRISKKSPKT